MTPTWPAVADIPELTPQLPPTGDAFPVRRDPALGPEATTEQLLQESQLITLGIDPLCGHLPGHWCDDECAYWRGVVLGEYDAPEGMEAVVEQVRARYAATRGAAA
ncbi:hypothetical protein [Micromonospora sp. CB01531]|uniref:hypothetical protein n=1 Tax=Micromonospora sp. CB01531 TaxID=1718947 RepID=UPI00093F9C6E|nr:hypothetical protein [Micromonospora sp. CB01531]OKI47202.1 hypothetical protein A6A27_10135 [Micromonospora sp. CB01531]